MFPNRPTFREKQVHSLEDACFTEQKVTHAIWRGSLMQCLEIKSTLGTEQIMRLLRLHYWQFLLMSVPLIITSNLAISWKKSWRFSSVRLEHSWFMLWCYHYWVKLGNLCHLAFNIIDYDQFKMIYNIIFNMIITTFLVFTKWITDKLMMGLFVRYQITDLLYVKA